MKMLTSLLLLAFLLRPARSTTFSHGSMQKVDCLQDEVPQKSFTTPSPAQCAVACVGFEQCLRFNYRSDQNICLLFTERYCPDGTEVITPQCRGFQIKDDMWCPGGFEYLPQSKRCVKGLIGPYSASAASLACADLDSHLITFSNFSKLREVSCMVNRLGWSTNTQFWTAGHVIDPTTFIWKHNSTYSTTIPSDPQLWEPGQPDLSQFLPLCVYIRPTSITPLAYQLNDDACTYALCAMCENQAFLPVA